MINSRSTNRRNFIKLGSLAPLSLPLAFHPPERQKEIICQDLAEHFHKRGTWVTWHQTTDRFTCGDPGKPVHKVSVVWKASLSAIEEAIAQKADLLISHESICVNADNQSTEPEEIFSLPSEKVKFDLLKKSGLTVYRCHDFWDRFPEQGVRDSWQRGLKLNGKIIVDAYPLYVTEIKPQTVHALAQHILRQIAPLQQDGVLVTGDMNKLVRRVATGTGVTVDPEKLWDLCAEVGIITDDYYRHVRQGVHAQEMDFPTIIVNHGVSEEWGIMNLAKYIQNEFPNLKVHYIRQYCPYKIVANTHHHQPD